MRAARLLLTFAAAATAVITTAVPATAIPPVDPYQSYVDPGCLPPVEQPGVRAFRDMIMSRVGGTSGGIHACSGYEHGEGRAWDWMREASVPAQAQHVQLVLDWLLATDSAGNPHAMARRLGIGNIIWNRRSISLWTSSAKVWNNYPCNGTPGSCHTNHVHFAFSWAGARQQTSWFTTADRPGDWYPGGVAATGQWSISADVANAAGAGVPDGRPDLIARLTDGNGYVYPHLGGSGTSMFAAQGYKIGQGWTSITALSVADIANTTGAGVPDGRPDLIARLSDGNGYVYPHLGGSGTSMFAALGHKIGQGWNSITGITVHDIANPAGAGSPDGRPDLIARLSDGNGYVYPHLGGSGTSMFAALGHKIGQGWNSITALSVADIANTTGAGSPDGRPDLIARLTDNNGYVYPHLGGSGTSMFAAQGHKIGQGWNSITLLS